MSHIVIVEDQAAHAELMRRAFEMAQDDYQVTVVSRLEDAREFLDGHVPDLVIADLMLPDGRSIELLPGAERQPEFPFVVMTSQGDESVAVEAMKAGAMDYIVKSEDVFRSMPHVANRALREWRQRRQLEQTQAQLRQMSKVFLDAADPILIEDLDWRIVEANREAEAFFGRSCEALRGLSVEALVPEGTREQARALYERCLAGEEVRGVETEHVDAEGNVRTVLLTLSRLTDPEGQATGVAAIAKDITERKRLEREFRQAQKMEAIGTLTSGIAHDFNNLLMGIMGCADIALGELEAQGKSATYIREIKDAAQRGASLTQQLLAFSRRGDTELRVVAFDDVVETSRAMLDPLVGEDVQVELETDADGANVKCSQGELEQVLVNLVVNARDAMPDGGTVTVRTGAVDFDEGDARLFGGLESGPHVALSVADTGTGMDEETIRQIFDPFFTTKGVGEGTGLGLSTVYGIIHQWGGEIDVDSELGEGTTFTIYVPQTDEALPETEVDSAQLGSGGAATVLVVEDEARVRLTVRNYLEEAGHRVLEAGDVDEALQLHRRHGDEVDLVVTDVVLPDRKGDALAAELRRRAPGLPVLFMSAYAPRKLAEDGLIDESDEVLQKPFTREVLIGTVAEMLDAEASDEPAEQAEHAGPAALLIEDNELARMATSTLLREDGFRVGEAENGSRARALLSEGFEPDVVVTDVNLPDVDGLELTEEIRREYPEAGVIIVSGGGREELGLADVLDDPYIDYIQKPIDVKKLSSSLRTLIAGTSAARK